MAKCGPQHKKLNSQGYGKCSVPMWRMGMPAGFCDRIAFGEPTKESKAWYDGHIPFLACYTHGGPKYNQTIPLGKPYHLGDPCIYCGIPHDEVEPGPCPARMKAQNTTKED